MRSAGVFCFWRSGPLWGLVDRIAASALAIVSSTLEPRSAPSPRSRIFAVADIPRPTMATAAKLFLVLGAVTPVGDVTFIGAWIAFTAAIVRA